MVIIGSGISVYNLLDFAHSTYLTKNSFQGSRMERLLAKHSGNASPQTVYYYYSANTLLWIALGVMLIVVGILIIRSKKKNLKNKTC